jgi:hypothetical protein
MSLASCRFAVRPLALPLLAWMSLHAWQLAAPTRARPFVPNSAITHKWPGAESARATCAGVAARLLLLPGFYRCVASIVLIISTV